MLGILNNLDLNYLDEIPKFKVSGPPKEGDRYYKVQTSWTGALTALFTGAKKYFPENFNEKVSKFLVNFQESHKDGGMTSTEELKQAGEILIEGREYIQNLEVEQEKKVRQINKSGKRAA